MALLNIKLPILLGDLVNVMTDFLTDDHSFVGLNNESVMNSSRTTKYRPTQKIESRCRRQKGSFPIALKTRVSKPVKEVVAEKSL